MRRFCAQSGQVRRRSVVSQSFLFQFTSLFLGKEMVAMRMIWRGLLASMLLSCTLLGPVVAQEAPKEKPRVYKHDFEGQDLSGRDFSKQNLDDANFADAVLKETKFERASLKNCNFQGAKLEGTNLSYADMTGSDFRQSSFKWPSIYQANFNGADLSGVDLNGQSTSEMKFREAKLRGTKGFNQIYGSDYYKADLRGADFSTAVLLDRTNFRKAKFDQFTRWPKGFVVEDHGLVFEETKAEEKPSPQTNPTVGNEKSEADFQKLDKNEDGVLSGTEMNGLKEQDANEDGEITRAEFLRKSQ